MGENLAGGYMHHPSDAAVAQKCVSFTATSCVFLISAYDGYWAAYQWWVEIQDSAVLEKCKRLAIFKKSTKNYYPGNVHR